MKKESGQTLVEALVAFGVATILIVALVAATTVAVSRSQFVKQRTQAEKYAQEGIEWIRAERDNNNWNTYFLPQASSGGGSRYCLNTLSWTTGGTCATFNLPAGGPFKREALLTRDVSGNKITVRITVSWQEGGRTHTSDQTTILTKWQE